MPGKSAKSPRRKPKQARARDTLEVVLEAAARVLVQRGYAAATTNRIAEAAGVGVGTVYEYFADKDAVFEALIEREIASLAAAFAAREASNARDEAPDLETAVGELITAGVVAMRHGPELYRALEAVPGASFRRHLAAAREGVISQVRRLLEVHREEVVVDELDLAAFVVVSAVEGVGANASSRDLDERLVRELTALVTRYLRGGAGLDPT